MRLVGAFSGFESSTAHDVHSASFDSLFPSSFRFDQVAAKGDCTDRRSNAYILNVILSAFVGFVLRPKRIVWFWTLVCIGYWHITFASEPRDYPRK